MKRLNEYRSNQYQTNYKVISKDGKEYWLRNDAEITDNPVEIEVALELIDDNFDELDDSERFVVIPVCILDSSIIDALCDYGYTVEHEGYTFDPPSPHRCIPESLSSDRHYSEDQADKFGDLICRKLNGKTISKDRRIANEPGGLKYEAEKLGIDMWDLLDALEGLCAQGKAREIDDSTYRIACSRSNNESYRASRKHSKFAFNETWADEKYDELMDKPKRTWTDDDWEAFNHIENLRAESDASNDDTFTPDYSWDDGFDGDEYEDDDFYDDDEDFEERDDLEIGFNPYMGCYDDDC